MSDKAMVHSGASASIPVEGGAGRFAELIARLEAAEVGSRVLDVRMVAACNPSEWGVGDLEIALEDPDRRLNPNHYTTSLDCALALAERVLPGCRCIAERDHDGTGWACVRASEDADRFMTDAKTPALALCAAILKALEAKQ